VTNESKQPPCSFLPPDSTAGDGFDFDFDFKLRVERRGGPGSFDVGESDDGVDPGGAARGGRDHGWRERPTPVRM
jgi:hypothetical protein